MNKRYTTNWLYVRLAMKAAKGKPIRREPDGEMISIGHQRAYAYVDKVHKIRCGFCSTEHIVNAASFAGAGKRCECCNSKIMALRTYAQIDDKMPLEILNLINNDTKNGDT